MWPSAPDEKPKPGNLISCKQPGRLLTITCDHHLGVSIESRWRVFTHLDAAVFVDAGSVAPTMRGLKFSDLKPAYGVGVRLHNNRVTMARLDFGHSVEGWHIYFRMNEPFRRTTQTNGYRPAAPYVP